jgi:hypothetical protein
MYTGKVHLSGTNGEQVAAIDTLMTYGKHIYVGYKQVRLLTHDTTVAAS